MCAKLNLRPVKALAYWTDHSHRFAAMPAKRFAEGDWLPAIRTCTGVDIKRLSTGGAKLRPLPKM